MIGIIAAVSSNGIIGVTDQNGKQSIPWNYPVDMKYFRETTKNSTVVFGRKTFQTINKPLPNRRNIVISSAKVEMEGIETFLTLGAAIETVKTPVNPSIITSGANTVMIFEPNIWLAGGAGIYEVGMHYADEIHLTVLQDIITSSPTAVRFPFINPRLFEVREWRQLTPGDDTLRLYIYKRV